MAFGYDSSSWLGAGTQPLAAGPGGLISLGQLQATPDQGGLPGLRDSDGYTISVGPDDWRYVDALGSLDSYSRLGRLLSSSWPQSSDDAGSWGLPSAEADPSVTAPPPPTSVMGSQPVTGVSPTDLSSLAPFFAPQISSPFGQNGPQPDSTIMGAQPVTGVAPTDLSRLIAPSLPQLTDPFGSSSDSSSSDPSAPNDPSTGLQPPPPDSTVMGVQPVTPLSPPNGLVLTRPTSGFSVSPAYWAQPNDSVWSIAQQAYGARDLDAGFEAIIRSNRFRLNQDGVPVVLRGQQLTLSDVSNLDPGTRAELQRAGQQRLALIARKTAARQAFMAQLQTAPPWVAQSQDDNPATPFLPTDAGADRLGIATMPFSAPGTVAHAPYAAPPLTLRSYLGAADRDFDRGANDANDRYQRDLHPATILQAGLEGLRPDWDYGRRLSVASYPRVLRSGVDWTNRHAQGPYRKGNQEVTENI